MYFVINLFIKSNIHLSCFIRHIWSDIFDFRVSKTCLIKDLDNTQFGKFRFARWPSSWIRHFEFSKFDKYLVISKNSNFSIMTYPQYYPVLKLGMNPYLNSRCFGFDSKILSPRVEHKSVYKKLYTSAMLDPLSRIFIAFKWRCKMYHEPYSLPNFISNCLGRTKFKSKFWLIIRTNTNKTF